MIIEVYKGDYICKCDICGMKYIATEESETSICINCLIERFE